MSLYAQRLDVKENETHHFHHHPIAVLADCFLYHLIALTLASLLSQECEGSSADLPFPSHSFFAIILDIDAM